RVAEAVTDQPRRVAALGPELQCAERDAERVGVDRPKLEAGTVGADGFHAHGATLDAGPQGRSGCGEPLPRVVCRLDQPLGKCFQPDDLALADASGPLLFLKGERSIRRKATVDEHDL